MQEWYLGWEKVSCLGRCPHFRGCKSGTWGGKSALFREVSSFQRLKCMQEWYLGWEKVSCLERCPHFRG